MTTSLTRRRRLGQPGDEVIPWLDQPPAESLPGYRRKPAEVGGARLLADTLPRTSSSSTTTAYTRRP